MSHSIHIFGASASGTTTFGKVVAERLSGAHLDADDYYWESTDPPYTHKRAPKKRIALIESDIEGEDAWVLSGSICSWGDPLLERFTLAVFLYLDPTLRLQRLIEREKRKYGSRLDSGQDMHEQHHNFVAWARSYDTAAPPTRSLALHEQWMGCLNCPIVRLNSQNPVESLCDSVVQSIELQANCRVPTI